MRAALAAIALCAAVSGCDQARGRSKFAAPAPEELPSFTAEQLRRQQPSPQAPTYTELRAERHGNDLIFYRKEDGRQTQQVIPGACVDPSKAAKGAAPCEDLWMPILATR